MLKITIFFVFFLYSFCLYSADDKYSHSLFQTKFGELRFTDVDGRIEYSDKVNSMLDNDIILSSLNETDGWGGPLFLMLPTYFDDSALMFSPNKDIESSPRYLARAIVSKGANANCGNRFVIMDFTGTKPYITDAFGYNPDGKYCLEFVKAKWGKKKSYIYLKGPLKYVYYTGGKVIGPLE